MSDSFNVVLVRDLSNQLKDFYYILRDVSRERDPEKVLAWANRNKHLWKHLLTEKPEGNTFLNVWDIKGKKTDLGLSDRAANIFGERKGYGDFSFSSWISQNYPTSDFFQFTSMGRKYWDAVEEVIDTVPTEDARSIKLAVRRLANSILTPLKFIVKLLEDSYPPHFTYKGFKIENPNNFSRYVTNQLLEGIEGLVATFKKRHVLPMLTQGISKITIRYWEVGRDSLKTAAYYNHKTGELILLKRLIDDRSGGSLGDLILQVTIHEFAHHVYYRQLSKEARNFWDSGWDAIEEAKKVDELSSKAPGVYLSDRQEYVDLLQKHNFAIHKVEEELERYPLEDLAILKFRKWLENPTRYDNSDILDGRGIVWINDEGTKFMTPEGKDLFMFFKNPERWMKEYKPELLKESPDTQKKELEWIERGIMTMEFGLQNGGFPEISSDDVRAFLKQEKNEDRVREEMGFPTDYAGTNPSEDFAETLMMFLLKPERLSKNALYRMQRTLSLSNLYGKPIMQLAKTEDKVQDKVRELAKKLILEGHADLALEVLAKRPAWRISKSGIKRQEPWFRGKPYTVETVPISKLDHMDLHEDDPECGKHVIFVDYKTKETSGGCTDHINSLREAIRSNKEMPPIVLYKDKYWKGYGVQDGNHRVAAAILEGYKEVPALVPTDE